MNIKYQFIWEHPTHGLMDGGRFDTFESAVIAGTVVFVANKTFEFKCFPFILTQDDAGGTSRVPGKYEMGVFVSESGSCLGQIMPVIE